MATLFRRRLSSFVAAATPTKLSPSIVTVSEATPRRVSKGKEKLPPLFAFGDAVDLLRVRSRARFDETVEIALGCKIDKGETLRGVALLPRSVGKELKIAVFAKGSAAEGALAAGAHQVGADELIKEISAGKVEFDRCFATPDMMPSLSRIARILGPRGLMPNTKNGTVVEDVAAAVRNAKYAKDFRADKAGVIHAAVGKLSFDNESLMKNVTALTTAIKAARQAEKKGKLLQFLYVSSTQGPAIPVDLVPFDIVASTKN